MKVVLSISTNVFRIVNLFLTLEAHVDSCIEGSNVSEFAKPRKLEGTRQNTAVFNLRQKFFLHHGEDEVDPAKIDRRLSASKTACAKSGSQEQAVLG